MAHIITLTPSGALLLHEEDTDSQENKDPWLKKVIKGFNASEEEGLFTLAASKPGIVLHPTFSYWRDFTCQYLTRLCRKPVTAEVISVEAPNSAELSTLILSVPPMQGGEYLSARVLVDRWTRLDAYIQNRVSSSNLTLSDWLKKYAPLWRQVGRVCFHLAENKNDPDYPFAFMATYAPTISKTGRVQYQPLSKALEEYAGARNKKVLIKLLSPVHAASQKNRFIKDLVDSGDIFHPMVWKQEDAYQLLKGAHLLEECGLILRLPDWWRKRPHPRVSVTIGDNKKTSLGITELMDFKIRLVLGDQKLTKKELKDLMKAKDGLVLLKGQWVEVNQEMLDEALSHWKKVEAEIAHDGISFIDGMRLLAGAPAGLSAGDSLDEKTRKWSFVNPGKWLSDLLISLRDPDRILGSGPGKGFYGELRPYQTIGFNWLRFLSGLGLGACLADDMGLGKTVQILSLLLANKKEKKKNTKPSLIVLPASLLANWKAEMRRFTPSLSIRIIHPSESNGADMKRLENDPDNYLANNDVVLTTYAMLQRRAVLQEVNWRLVILDEAQAIKNPASSQTRAVKKLKSGSRIALTGTPVENRLSDLWSLFDFLSPGLLGSKSKFKNFIKLLEKRECDRYAPLRNLVQPYILRRLKTDKKIISDLPEKTEIKTFCGLAKPQAILYKKTVNELAESLVMEETTGLKRRGLILSFLMRFKQICNHPSNYLGDDIYNPSHSGKFERLSDLCEEMASRQEKVLVFTQFKEMTEPLSRCLANIFGREGLILHGSVAVKKRKSLVNNFQMENGPPFFVLSLKAGGVGLNLTAASHVIHFDRWWNPAVENQATDRAFRIGQKRNVMVHKFVCQGTVEEKIDKMIEEKVELADDVLKGGTDTLLTEMSDDELLNMVALDIDKAKV